MGQYSLSGLAMLGSLGFEAGESTTTPGSIFGDDEDAAEVARRSAQCRARGGVCRNITTHPVQANEQMVRGLCTGPSNIVCVIPRAPAPTPGGGTGPRPGSGGGGSRPAPPIVPAPAFEPGIPGQMDWGSVVLVGGSVLFLGAVFFAVVKKRRAQRAQMAVANRRRRRRNRRSRV